MDLPNEAKCRDLTHARSLGFCEIRVPHVCLGRATSKHHRFKPGRVWLPANVVDACGDGTTGCHGWIEANPTLAHERGLWLFANELPAATPAILTWRGVTDWYQLTNTGGFRWPGYPEGSVPPLVS